MTATPRTIKALFNAYYAAMSTYRAEIFLWALATCLPLIMMGIWVQAGSSGAFEGFTSADAVRYFIAVFVMRQLSICWVVYEFEYNVVSGRLSALLLQPLDPIWRYILMHAGEQATRLPFSLVFIGLSLFIFPEALFIQDQTVESSGGLWLPQWWREGINYLPYLFLSGLVVPLQTLPPALQEVILWTPYPYMLWFPAQLIAASPEAMPPALILRGIATILGWILFFALLQRVLWRRGLRHYSAMGA